MRTQDLRAGIVMMVATTIIFALQDGISRHLAAQYNTYMVVMVRYWFFALFVIAMVMRRPGGLGVALRAHHPWLQSLRALLLVAEIYVMIFAFVHLGLIDTHAVFICYPLLVAALSGPILGERVGWRRWVAIGIGFLGVLVILQPGGGMFSLTAAIPLAAAAMFAVYGLLTRYVARQDAGEVSFFWTGIVGAIFATLVGMWFWQPMSAPDWGWMALLCLTAVAGHGLLIRAYEVAEASALQPFAYLQLVWGAALGMSVFGDTLRPNVVAGAAIVASAGLFTLWRARKAAA
jgi:S-adenosylmethionine uptake transporter